MNTSEIQPLALSVADTAKRLSVGKTTCFALIRAGNELESFLVGRKRLVTVRSIDAFVARKCLAARLLSESDNDNL